MIRLPRSRDVVAMPADPAPPLHGRLVVGGWVLVALAVPWLLLGGGAALRTARFLATAERGVAEVVSSYEEPSARSSPWWMTTFSLPAPDGTRLTARWRGERAFTPGEAVPVRFRAAPPAIIQPDDRWASWRWAWVLSGAGAAHLLVGAVMIGVGIMLRRRSRISPPPTRPG